MCYGSDPRNGKKAKKQNKTKNYSEDGFSQNDKVISTSEEVEKSEPAYIAGLNVQDLSQKAKKRCWFKCKMTQLLWETACQSDLQMVKQRDFKKKKKKKPLGNLEGIKIQRLCENPTKLKLLI